jgi:hypothetical protein
MQKQTEHLELLKKYIFHSFIFNNLMFFFSVLKHSKVYVKIFLVKYLIQLIKLVMLMENSLYDRVQKVIHFILLRKVRFLLLLKFKNRRPWFLFIGGAQITQSKSKWDSAVYVRHLERGDSFGEAALQS